MVVPDGVPFLCAVWRVVTVGVVGLILVSPNMDFCDGFYEITLTSIDITFRHGMPR